jgi:hypothetical protein
MATARDETEPGPGGRWSTLWTVLILALVVYVLPLIALAIDELILGTYWIHKQFPRGARAVFFDVYPFLRFME